MQEAERDDRVRIDEVRKLGAQAHLVEEQGDVENDQPVIDVRGSGRRDRVLQGYDGNAPSKTPFLFSW